MRNVLVVEPEPAIRDLYEAVLPEMGFVVNSFPNGADALMGVAVKRFHLAILDLENRGDILSIEMRKNQPDMVIIMTKASGIPGPHQCDLVLQKPVTGDHLLHALKLLMP